MEQPMNSGMPVMPAAPKSHVPAIITTAIITAVVVGGLVYALVPKAQAPTPSATPSPSVDTTGWQRYRNENYGFEFKYPATFPEPAIGTNFSVSYLPEISGQIADNYYNGTDRAVLNGTIEIGGLVAHKFYTTECVGQGCIAPVLDYILLWQGHPLSIEFSGELANSSEIPQILSTFKFITPAVDTLTWKTYSNAKYGFTVKYPITFRYQIEKPVDSDYRMSFFEPGNGSRLTLKFNEGWTDDTCTHIRDGGDAQVEELNIDGFQTRHYICNNDPDGREFYSIFVTDKASFSIGIMGDQNSHDIFHAMLTTFKFIK